MVLEEKGKDDLPKVQYSTDLANIFVRQKEQGLGHAIHTARQFV